MSHYFFFLFETYCPCVILYRPKELEDVDFLGLFPSATVWPPVAELRLAAVSADGFDDDVCDAPLRADVFWLLWCGVKFHVGTVRLDTTLLPAWWIL